MGAPTKFSIKAGCLSFVSNYIEETVPFRNIRYIEAEDKVCHLYVRELDHFDTYIPLSKLYERLPKELFVQVNRSCIVAIDEVSLVSQNHVLLFDGTRLPITQKHFENVNRVHERYVQNFNSKKERQALTEEIEKYHLLDISPVPRCLIEMIFDGDTPIDFEFHYVNDAFVRLFELQSKDQMLGKTFRNVFKNINEKWMDFFAPTALNGIPQNTVIKSIESGKELYVRCYQPFHGYVVSIMQDVRLIREALKTEEVF